MKTQIFISILFALIVTTSVAQVDSTWQKKPHLDISGFVDTYYVFDFNEPAANSRQPFLFNHNRHNEFNVNLAILKLALTQSKYRANIALQIGTYAVDNYAAEAGVLQNIFEANVGISLNAKNNLWLDAGVLPSHLGFENAMSIENMTLTRSLAAENSPYFLTGAKVTYTPNDKWELAALITNGWQRIQRLEGNSLPSFGTQVVYNPGTKLSFNWSTFIGTDDPDTSRRMRYFNNFYTNLTLDNGVSLIAGVDIGVQQKATDSSTYNTWFTPVIITKVPLNNSWSTAVRAEYYQDPTGIIIPTTTTNGFRTTGLSLNADYEPVKNISCRIEGRWFHSQDAVFTTPNGMSKNNFFIATSLAIKFAERLSK